MTPMIASRRSKLVLALVALLIMLLSVPMASADDPVDDGVIEEPRTMLDGSRRDPSTPLMVHDMSTTDIVSSGPSAKVIKNLATSGRGDRLMADVTTDVWALGGYAYTGTFNSPCGGEAGAGVWIWDVHNRNQVSFVDIIASPTGSRANDVKVASMNSGDILVHSNESCAGGPGGFEVYNIDDPESPVPLASVQTDDVNLLLQGPPFFFTDFGVHNLFLFTQDDKDYVSAVVESEFGNFQIFDITDPTNPSLVGFWGSEEIRMVELGEDPSTVPDLGVGEFGLILALDAWLFDGFGASQNRFLHDITISDDGTRAYLSNWDAGLVLLDISDPTDPTLVSVALDSAEGSLDEEVNSHAAWPSADGTIVVETEEDFGAWVSVTPLSNFTFLNQATNTIPGVGISTNAGDDFEANQTGNDVTVTATSVTVNSGPLAGNVYPAVEGFGSQPKLADTGPITGEAVWIGRACDGDPILNSGAVGPGDVAIVRRGACFFWEKLKNAAALGASAIAIANNEVNDTPWGGVRIWDYSDPADPVLASTFNTTCSASATPISECDPGGTYSVHNVIVESLGKTVKAYISWYWDGVLILDITDPYNPVEVARFFDNSPEFLAENGDNPHDFWGVYKEQNSPWIYASDRNGGLYVFKEYGSGSRGKK